MQLAAQNLSPKPLDAAESSRSRTRAGQSLFERTKAASLKPGKARPSEFQSSIPQELPRSVSVHYNELGTTSPKLQKTSEHVLTDSDGSATEEDTLPDVSSFFGGARQKLPGFPMASLANKTARRHRRDP